MKRKLGIIIAGVTAIAFSAIASVAGTVAWFTANNVVSASNLNIQAEAEEGIVISNEGKSTWKTSTEASHTSATYNSKGFIPTSTSTGAAWYHTNSDDVNDYQKGAQEEYATLSINSPVTDGVGTATVNGIQNRNIYLLNHFYVQSAIATELTNQKLFIKSVSATDSANKALNKSLRILFKLSSAVAIYCPLADGNFTAVSGTNAGDAHKASASGSVTEAANIDSFDLLHTGTIPAYTAAGTNALDLEVYLFFEGEDTNCKSANIDTLNSVSVSFELKNLPYTA